MTLPSKDVIALSEGFLERRIHGDRCRLAAVVALGFALRIIRLGTPAYWQDEVYNLLKAEHIRSVLTGGELVSNEPPLFSILVLCWRTIGLDKNEWLMRLLPVALGLAAIVALYTVGKYLFGPRAGLLAAFLLAISPSHVLHSQDLKHYVLLSFTGVVAAYALYRAAEQNRRRDWVFYTIAASAACYSEMFAVFLLAAVNLWFVVQLCAGGMEKVRVRVVSWVIANVVAALLFLPYAPVMFEKIDNIMFKSTAWWIPQPTPWSVLFYMKTIAFGYSNREPHFKIAMIIFAVFGCIGVWAAFRRNPRSNWFLLSWFVIPPAMVYAVSLFTESIFLIRALLIFAMPVYLWIGLAVASMRPMMLRVTCLMVFASVATYPLLQRYRDEYPLQEYPHRPGIHPSVEYREAAKSILARWHEGDIVVHSGMSSWFPLYWYGLRGRPQFSVTTSSAFKQLIEEGNPPAVRLPEFQGYFVRLLQPTVEGRNRVWFIFSEWERAYLAGNPWEVWQWLDAHYCEVFHETFKGLEVLLYERDHEGQPIRVVKRDRDDGVSACITYNVWPNRAYEKIKPDPGLVPSPPDARRGALTLRFEENAAGPLFSLAASGRTRTVSFALENHAKTDISCLMMCVLSDEMQDAASFFETRAESDAWRIGRMYNSQPPPSEYDYPVANGRPETGDNNELTGKAVLPNGECEAFVWMLGPPDKREYQRARLSIWVGDIDLLAGISGSSRLPVGWYWYDTGMRVSEGTSRVRVVASPLSDGDAGWANVGAIAFRKVRTETATKGLPSVLPNWPGEVTVPGGATMCWSVEIDSDMSRIDVWAFERGENGRAYRIFETR